ncbi:element excision factor XisH family protein [Mastigocoleus sp. MO_188.B34]
MPAKDIFHDTVKRALQKDGWLVNSFQIFYFGCKDNNCV